MKERWTFVVILSIQAERDPSEASMHHNPGRENLRDFHGWQE
jgi:hypothetical protein